MNTTKFFVCFFISSILFMSCQQHQPVTKDVYDELVKGDDLSCDKEIVQAISVLAELGKFRSSNEQPLSQADDSKIRILIDKLKDKKNLFDFARLTMTVRRFSPSDECLKSRLEETYSRAFWYSIEILAQDRSKENLDKLEHLKRELSIDGGDAYNWSNFVYRIPAP